MHEGLASVFIIISSGGFLVLIYRLYRHYSDTKIRNRQLDVIAALPADHQRDVLTSENFDLYSPPVQPDYPKKRSKNMTKRSQKKPPQNVPRIVRIVEQAPTAANQQLDLEA